MQLDTSWVWRYAFRPDGALVLTGNDDQTLRLWDVETGRCLRTFEGHSGTEGIQFGVRALAWSPNQNLALSGSTDTTIRLWEVETGRCLRVFEGHTKTVMSVAWSLDQRRFLSGSWDETIRLWEIEKGTARVIGSHNDPVDAVVWSADQRLALSGGQDARLMLWDIETRRCLRVFDGHTAGVWCVALSQDQRLALSGSGDDTIRVWDVRTGRCLAVLEGHTSQLSAVRWSADHRHILSCADNVRLWELETGRCLLSTKQQDFPIRSASFGDAHRVFVGGNRGLVQILDLSRILKPSPMPDQAQYTNAKVLLVGESGTGEAGLSVRLASNVVSDDGVEREIWLWDFGGQADQRLIHQFYMDETALVVSVVDVGSEELNQAILDGIRWENIHGESRQRRFAD